MVILVEEEKERRMEMRGCRMMERSEVEMVLGG